VRGGEKEGGVGIRKGNRRLNQSKYIVSMYGNVIIKPLIGTINMLIKR
jgi:hypothetical protein